MKDLEYSYKWLKILVEKRKIVQSKYLNKIGKNKSKINKLITDNNKNV